MTTTNMKILSRISRLLGLLAVCCPWADGMAAGAENLVPARPGTAPNYWCTWSVQNYMYGIGSPTVDPKELEGDRAPTFLTPAMEGDFQKYKPNCHEGQCLEHSDVFRTYDVSAALSLPTTLDRVAAALAYGNRHKVRALINCEDEVYLAATLGCTMGIMRHPLVGKRPSLDPDPAFNCSRQCKRRMDEVVRALRWQRIAQSFARFSDEPHPEDATRIDERVLADVWTFKPGEMWWSEAIGKPFGQCAPARVSRGLPLPEVASEGEPPFVVAGRFPNGAVAVATQGRTLEGKNWFFSPTDVTLKLGSASGPIGIFGHYRSLTLQCAAPLGAARILAQDLAGEQAEDITSEVIIKANTLTLPGALVEKVGLRAASQGDLSDPGLVLVIQKMATSRKRFACFFSLNRNEKLPV